VGAEIKKKERKRKGKKVWGDGKRLSLGIERRGMKGVRRRRGADANRRCIKRCKPNFEKEGQKEGEKKS